MAYRKNAVASYDSVEEYIEEAIEEYIGRCKFPIFYEEQSSYESIGYGRYRGCVAWSASDLVDSFLEHYPFAYRIIDHWEETHEPFPQLATFVEMYFMASSYGLSWVSLDDYFSIRKEWFDVIMDGGIYRPLDSISEKVPAYLHVKGESVVNCFITSEEVSRFLVQCIRKFHEEDMYSMLSRITTLSPSEAEDIGVFYYGTASKLTVCR